MNGRMETWATIGSAFGAGLVYGALGKYWPKTTLPVALTEAIGGPIGAVFTGGMTSELLEGVGSAGVALVGASMPNWISPPVEGESVGVIPAGRSIRLRSNGKGHDIQRREIQTRQTPRDKVPSTAIAEI